MESKQFAGQRLHVKDELCRQFSSEFRLQDTAELRSFISVLNFLKLETIDSPEIFQTTIFVLKDFFDKKDACHTISHEFEKVKGMLQCLLGRRFPEVADYLLCILQSEGPHKQTTLNDSLYTMRYKPPQIQRELPSEIQNVIKRQRESVKYYNYIPPPALRNIVCINRDNSAVSSETASKTKQEISNLPASDLMHVISAKIRANPELNSKISKKLIEQGEGNNQIRLEVITKAIPTKNAQQSKKIDHESSCISQQNVKIVRDSDTLDASRREIDKQYNGLGTSPGYKQILPRFNQALKGTGLKIVPVPSTSNLTSPNSGRIIRTFTIPGLVNSLKSPTLLRHSDTKGKEKQQNETEKQIFNLANKPISSRDKSSNVNEEKKSKTNESEKEEDGFTNASKTNSPPIDATFHIPVAKVQADRPGNSNTVIYHDALMKQDDISVKLPSTNIAQTTPNIPTTHAISVKLHSRNIVQTKPNVPVTHVISHNYKQTVHRNLQGDDNKPKQVNATHERLCTKPSESKGVFTTAKPSESKGVFTTTKPSESKGVFTTDIKQFAAALALGVSVHDLNNNIQTVAKKAEIKPTEKSKDIDLSTPALSGMVTLCNVKIEENPDVRLEQDTRNKEMPAMLGKKEILEPNHQTSYVRNDDRICVQNKKVDSINMKRGISDSIETTKSTELRALRQHMVNGSTFPLTDGVEQNNIPISGHAKLVKPENTSSRTVHGVEMENGIKTEYIESIIATSQTEKFQSGPPAVKRIKIAAKNFHGHEARANSSELKTENSIEKALSNTKQPQIVFVIPRLSQVGLSENESNEANFSFNQFQEISHADNLNNGSRFQENKSTGEQCELENRSCVSQGVVAGEQGELESMSCVSQGVVTGEQGELESMSCVSQGVVTGEQGELESMSCVSQGVVTGEQGELESMSCVSQGVVTGEQGELESMSCVSQGVVTGEQGELESMCYVSQGVVENQPLVKSDSFGNASQVYGVQSYSGYIAGMQKIVDSIQEPLNLSPKKKDYGKMGCVLATQPCDANFLPEKSQQNEATHLIESSENQIISEPFDLSNDIVPQLSEKFPNIPDRIETTQNSANNGRLPELLQVNGFVVDSTREIGSTSYRDLSRPAETNMGYANFSPNMVELDRVFKEIEQQKSHFSSVSLPSHNQISDYNSNMANSSYQEIGHSDSLNSNLYTYHPANQQPVFDESFEAPGYLARLTAGPLDAVNTDVWGARNVSRKRSKRVLKSKTMQDM